ncbi:MAG: N-acetyl-gamma-glutamyl-phosphate reductase [Oscillospiraceae bacterium]|nr:N-acetyl-gamma-glutamyl-phosphate reductase [Oscillospiraceae bacterium]
MKAAIIGATGYVGVELLRLLLNHPGVETAAVSSVSFEGKKLSEVYPGFYNIFDRVLCGKDEAIAAGEIIFASLPHGICEPLAKKCLAAGKKFIDFGADFRLVNEEDYKKWYGGEFAEKALHNEAVYGLPELFAEKIKAARLVANPGCYPTSVILGLAPAIGRLGDFPPVIDSKSGVTGAGRGLAQNLHYAECNEAFAPYKIAAHRHLPEIEQELSFLAGREVRVSFTPHLLPINRGIISTIYFTLEKIAGLDEIHALYKDFYKDKTFVRVLEKGETASLKNVRFSNFCDISLHYDAHVNRFIIVSAIDNMVKGAAGQAVQNMNLMFNLPEIEGLGAVPPVF